MAFGPIGTLRCKQFDVFKDYLGLANVLKGIQEEKTSGNSDSFTDHLGHPRSSRNRPCQSLSNKPTVPVLFSTWDPRPVSADQKRIDSAVCGFCSGQHPLKSPCSGEMCPVLRSCTCPICNATGDKAHTRKYCPRKYWYCPNYKRA